MALHLIKSMEVAFVLPTDYRITYAPPKGSVTGWAMRMYRQLTNDAFSRLLVALSRVSMALARYAAWRCQLRRIAPHPHDSHPIVWGGGGTVLAGARAVAVVARGAGLTRRTLVTGRAHALLQTRNSATLVATGTMQLDRPQPTNRRGGMQCSIGLNHVKSLVWFF